MKRYVVGFLFDSVKGRVLLIEKKRPEWQLGKLNGIGGGINEHENEFDAMSREFQEEAGLLIYPQDWKQFHILKDELVEVYFFYYIGVNAEIHSCKSRTDEELKIIDVYNLHYENTIPNLKWLIPMCLDEQHIFSESKSNITVTQVKQDNR